MKTTSKIVISQIVAIVGSYFMANWLGDFSKGSFFDVKASAFAALFYWPLAYMFLITFISNLWFQIISRLNYFIPSILILVFIGYLNFSSSDLWPSIEFWLVAFVGGWILAWIVNFVVGLVKSGR